MARKSLLLQRFRNACHTLIGNNPNRVAREVAPPPPAPHHLACGSALGGSGWIVKCDPEGAHRDETEGLRKPLVGRAGLRCQSPGQMPRPFATQRGEDRCVLAVLSFPDPFPQHTQ